MASRSRRRHRQERSVIRGSSSSLDFVPTEEYSAADAARSYEEAAWVVALAGEIIERLAG